MSLSLWEYVFCSLASTLGLGLLGPEVTWRLCPSQSRCSLLSGPLPPDGITVPLHSLSSALWPCRCLSFQLLITEQ